MFLFSYFGSCADIVDSPDVTLAGTDDNYDLLLSETIYVAMLYLAANVEALSEHPKAWRRTRSRCRSSWDLRI